MRRFSNFSTVFIIGPDWSPSFMAEQILLFNQLGITLPINAWVVDSLWLCFLTNYWHFSRGQLAREEYRFLSIAIFCVFNVEISCLRRKNRISWKNVSCVMCPMGFQLQTSQGNKHPLALTHRLLLLVLMNLLHVAIIIFPSYDFHCYREWSITLLFDLQINQVSLHETGIILKNYQKKTFILLINLQISLKYLCEVKRLIK